MKALASGGMADKQETAHGARKRKEEKKRRRRRRKQGLGFAPVDWRGDEGRVGFCEKSVLGLEAI